MRMLARHHVGMVARHGMGIQLAQLVRKRVIGLVSRLFFSANRILAPSTQPLGLATDNPHQKRRQLCLRKRKGLKMSEQKVSVAMWRVSKAARLAPAAVAAHRDSVPGVSELAATLVPNVDAFLRASSALAVFESQRKIALERHAIALKELHLRTLFWLTYVRMDVPGYEASDTPTGRYTPDALIERAERLLEHVKSFAPDATRPYYTEQLTAELTPLYEQAVRAREEDGAMAADLARLQRDARTLMAPVHRDVTTLRALLRNALGSGHPHVRALGMAPRKRSAGVVDAHPDTAPPVMPEERVNTAQRMAIGQA